MFRRILLGVVLIAVFWSLVARCPAGEMRLVRHEDGAGGGMWYRLYLPDNYDPARKYPMTLFMHGADGTNIRPITDPETQVEIPVPALVAALRNERHASVLVVPQLEEGAWGVGANDRLVMGLLASVERNFSIDFTRRYATGLSYGGFGTWRTMAEHPDYFAAGVPVAGGSSPSIAARVKHIPIWAFHGTQDNVVPVNTMRSTIDAVRAAGGEPWYTEVPSERHEVWNRAYDENFLPPSVRFELHLDSQQKTFELLASSTLADNSGLYRYQVYLDGVTSLEHLSPKSESSPSINGPAGFQRFRSADDVLPLRAEQNNLTPGMLLRVGQTPGMLPDAGLGLGEVQAQFDAPVQLAAGTFADFAAVDFADFNSQPNNLGAVSATILVPSGNRLLRLSAVTYRAMYVDGELVSETGRQVPMYDWLFSQHLVPEPSTGGLACLALLGFGVACGRARASR